MAIQGEVRATHGAVAVDIGTQEMARAGGFVPGHEIVERVHFVRGPARAGQLPEAIAKARVQGEHDALGAVTTNPRRHRFRIADGHAADDDALHPCIQEATYAILVTNTATRLHPEAATRGDAGNSGQVLEVA